MIQDIEILYLWILLLTIAALGTLVFVIIRAKSRSFIKCNDENYVENIYDKDYVEKFYGSDYEIKFYGGFAAEGALVFDYCDCGHELRFTVPSFDGFDNSVVLVPDNDLWAEAMPGWAKSRREEIMGRLREHAEQWSIRHRTALLFQDCNDPEAVLIRFNEKLTRRTVILSFGSEHQKGKPLDPDF